MMKTYKLKRFLAILMLVLASGCASTTPRVETIDEMDQILAEGANHVPAETAENMMTAEEVSKALMPTMKMDPPPVSSGSAGSGQTIKKDNQRFDISVSNVPADQFYMSLVEGTNYNIVVHPDLEGTISLNLKNVTIVEVMDAVRDVYGYEFERTGYGLRVLPNALESRIFQVDYLNVERSGVSSTSVSSGTLQSGSSSSGDSGSSDSGGSGSGSTGTQVTTQQPLTSFWQELDLSIKSIIGSEDGRSVIISPQSGLVVVRAIPNELRDVEKYLKAAQLISQRQVILEAKVLEVELNDNFRSGVNWAAFAGSFTAGHTGGGTSLDNDGGLSDYRDFTTPAGFNLGEVVPVSSFGGVFSLAVNGSKFNAFIELLETQGSVQVLSSPRISTMNNQKAVIKVGQDEFFVTNISSDSATGGAGTNQTAEIELTPFFSGIALDVTPQISADNDVTLHIHPSVSRVNEQQKLLQVNGQQQSLPLARSTIRESDSIIRAQSGQIVVIGGLMQDSINDRDAKTPGAGDVPLFGDLFKHKARSKTKSELIILLRPVVVDSPRRWADAINDSRHNVGELRQDVMDWRQPVAP